MHGRKNIKSQSVFHCNTLQSMLHMKRSLSTFLLMEDTLHGISFNTPYCSQSLHQYHNIITSDNHTVISILRALFIDTVNCVDSTVLVKHERIWNISKQ